MIVQERENEFLLIEQHDHAQISGQMVLEWKKNFLLRSKLREDADWAIAQHDRAWIPLDKNPKWNDEENRPYSFIDYPLTEKIAAYQRGIEEVASQSLYAGMLCSMHYLSFFSEDSKDPEIRQFISEEKKRQEDLFEAMAMDVPKDIYLLHFKRLQFCDDLSLYVCMQEPGIPKEEEVSWFRNGFRQSFDFAPDGIMSHWVDEKQVSLKPFPFERPFEVQIPYRLVSKTTIQDKGLNKAYQEAETHQRKVTFIRED
ncbi:DUF3891 family protein [Halobacillus sp. BBL2006]|uniref:DUF3891 family protein n=1 Tax=Halobacillus sp. BBL2006 TaxID=1543706 RepID=UPI000542798E|nr:DUF3891 family protein [Halobacillus sp. BBL2006]KHE72135.1 hypothetical protein LD39_06130 [Halobacillus sp. BBL2006]